MINARILKKFQFQMPEFMLNYSQVCMHIDNHTNKTIQNAKDYILCDCLSVFVQSIHFVIPDVLLTFARAWIKIKNDTVHVINILQRLSCWQCKTVSIRNEEAFKTPCQYII